MAKRKAAPKDDAVEGSTPQEAPDNSVYIGKSLKPESKPQFIYLQARQSARADHRRDRYGQDRDVAGAG